MELKPRNDNVIIEMLPLETVSPGGIVIPATQERDHLSTRQARVIASGPGYRLRGGRGPLVPNETRAGDTVLVHDTAGQRAQDWGLDHDSERGNSGASYGELRIIREDEVLAIVEQRE